MGETDLKSRYPDGPMWATLGPYIRKSMLRYLALAISDYELDNGDFKEGVCMGTGQSRSTAEEAIAAEIADVLDIDPDDDSERIRL